MKKLFSMVLVSGLVFSSVVPVSANSSVPKTDEFESDLVEIDFDYEKDKAEFEKMIEDIEEDLLILDRDPSIFITLTDKEWEEIAAETEDFDEIYSDLSKEEVNALVYEEYVNKSEENPFKPFYVGGMNPKEARVCAANPIDCSKVKGTVTKARDEAAKRYKKEYLHNNNGDAFRHAYWNKLMTNSIGASEAKKFADAHEYGASGQPKIEELMDLQNNRIGRNNSSLSASKIVTNLVDKGITVRLTADNKKHRGTNKDGKK